MESKKDTEIGHELPPPNCISLIINDILERILLKQEARFGGATVTIFAPVFIARL